MDKQTKKPCFIHMAGILFSHKNEKKILPVVTTWMDPKGIRLSKTQKDKHYVMSLKRGILTHTHTPNS